MRDHEAGRTTRLPLAAVLGYGAGGTIEGVVNNTLSLFLLFYATAVCGLSGGLAGLALSLGLVVDAVADPAIGIVSDGWHSRWGRRIPFMAVGLPVAAASLVAIFSLPAGVGDATLFWLLLSLSTLLRLSMSTFVLPFMAFGAELSDDHGERSRIVAWRWACTMTAGLAVVLAAFGLFFSGVHGTLVRDAYTPFALACAALVGIMGTLSIVVSLRLRHRTHTVTPDRSTGLTGVGIALRDAARHRSLVVLIASTFALFIAQGVTLSLELHQNTYFWRLSSGDIQSALLSLYLGLILGAPAIGKIANRIEKRAILMSSLVLLMLVETVPTALGLLGAIPVATAATVRIVVAAHFLMGLSLCGAAIAVTSMLADAADEHDLLFGARREGLLFAGWTFAAKAAGGIGAGVSGLVLELSGFPGNGATLTVRPETVRAIGIAYGPGAAIFSLIGAIVLLGYRLDRTQQARIMRDLERRRGASDAMIRPHQKDER